VFFARHAAQVTLAVRGPDLERSMSSYLIDQVRAIPHIDVRTGTRVDSCSGEEHLERVTLVNDETGDKEEIDVSHVFIFIGAQPLTAWLPDQVRLDDAGFVVTGRELIVDGAPPPGWNLERDPYPLESSLPGLFVAGDVRSQSVKRVASAVGEGAMAVTLVHQYLAGQ
jgi:thioredoxin reductase (NADPH)